MTARISGYDAAAALAAAAVAELRSHYALHFATRMRSESLFRARLPGTRARYVVLALTTILVGLFVHLRAAALGPAARDVLGDALWAAMIAWWAGAIAPGARLAARSAAVYAFCIAVEVSQLYHTPTLDAVRATRAGHLVLGSGFDPRDLAAYALGVAVAAVVDAVVVARGRRPRPPA